MAATSLELAPFFVFGISETLQEDIEVVKVLQRRMYFSNGESVYSPKNLLISLYQMISFLFSAGVVMLSTRYATLFITRKTSLQLYEYFLKKWPIRKENS